MTHKSRGMTLVEILIALAIASLMTLTGWRAVDALQSSRDRVVTEAAQWQRVDDFFVTLEADLRRASISEFNGNSDTITRHLRGTIHFLKHYITALGAQRNDNSFCQLVHTVF